MSEDPRSCCTDPRHQEDERETPADAGCCQTCRLVAHVAVAMAILTLVTGLLVCLVSFTAPAEDHTSTALMEQQCHKRLKDLDLMLHAVTQDSRCSLCPTGWSWWRSRCYFFSVGQQEDRRWIESADFCLQRNSSLAVIQDPAEMEFIQGVMRKFPRLPFLWVGLTDAEQEGQWLWGDGADVQHYMPLTVEWDAERRDCADLRGGGRLFASSCDAFGPWACKRDS